MRLAIWVCVSSENVSSGWMRLRATAAAAETMTARSEAAATLMASQPRCWATTVFPGQGGGVERHVSRTPAGESEKFTVAPAANPRRLTCCRLAVRPWRIIAEPSSAMALEPASGLSFDGSSGGGGGGGGSSPGLSLGGSGGGGGSHVLGLSASAQKAANAVCAGREQRRRCGASLSHQRRQDARQRHPHIAQCALERSRESKLSTGAAAV